MIIDSFIISDIKETRQLVGFIWKIIANENNCLQQRSSILE